MIILGFALEISWVIAILVFITLKTTEQGVSNKRVILKKGFISRKTYEVKMTAIETVRLEQSIIGRLFGYGSIRVTGRGISDVVFNYLQDPLEVKKRIESISNPL